MIQTPMHTRMNANSVPMLVISPTTSSGMKAANSPVNTKNSMFDLYGVRYFGCTSEKIRSEEHTSELQSPYVISYAVFCLKKQLMKLQLLIRRFTDPLLLLSVVLARS